MRRFWSFIVEPVLRDRAPARVVEIGSQSGESTARLLKLCGEIGAHLDVIDTVDMANASEIEALLQAHGRFHKGLSLDVLPTLPSAEVYLIDGDHNWFTVMAELSAIHDAVEHAHEPGPVIILHDVAWPYARRDLYYDPSNVPTEGKQPIALGGIRPGRSEVVDGDGLNAHLHHADHEGGAKNGVRTAVEDFLAAHADTYRFASVPGLNGLGFIYKAAAADSDFARRIEGFCNLDPAQVALLNATESGRLQLGIEVEQVRRKHAADVATLQAVIAARDNRIANYERKMAAIVDSRGYRTLQRARAVRRKLRRT